MIAGSDHVSTSKGSAIDLEVAGSGPVSCCFPFLLFLYHVQFTTLTFIGIYYHGT